MHEPQHTVPVLFFYKPFAELGPNNLVQVMRVPQRDVRARGSILSSSVTLLTGLCIRSKQDCIIRNGLDALILCKQNKTPGVPKRQQTSVWIFVQ